MEDTLISTLINLPPLTAVASSLLVREADKPLVWNEQQRRLNCSAVEHLFSAAAELHNVTGSERCCMQQTWLASYQQQLLGSSCSLVSSQLQLLLSNFPRFQPSWKDPPAQLVWKHELGGAECRADLLLMSQNQTDNVGANRPLSVHARFILHRTLL